MVEGRIHNQDLLPDMNMLLFTAFRGVSPLLWLPLCVYGATFKMTYEEGQSGIFSCRVYENFAWNVTFTNGTKLTVCNGTICINKNSTGVQYSVVLRQGNTSYLNISSVQRNMTKILCTSLDPYQRHIRNTWLLSIVVRPTVPVCSTPALTPISKNNYMFKITCKTTVHPRANCSVLTTNSFGTWDTKISYDDQKSWYTGLYTTQCTISLSIYAETFVSADKFQVTVYPDVLQGEQFQASNEWRTLFPEEPVNAQVVSFEANMQTGSVEVAVGSDVTFICKGIGPPGTTLTLYNSTFYDRLLARGDINDELVYKIKNIQCVATSTIKCVAGDDVTTRAKEIIVGVLRCPSTECCDNDMILPLVITLTSASIVTLIIVLCCVRLRRRLYKFQTGTASRTRDQIATHNQNGISPPSYNELFHTDVIFASRPDLTLPDYVTLPPPYAEVVQDAGPCEPSSTCSEWSAPLEPRAQEEPQTRGHTPAAYPTFML